MIKRERGKERFSYEEKMVQPTCEGICGENLDGKTRGSRIEVTVSVGCQEVEIGQESVVSSLV